MGSLTKQTISAQIPIELAAAVENLAIELDRSKSWIIKEALTSMLARTASPEHPGRSCGCGCRSRGEPLGHGGFC
jgi:hypothetical protein